MVLFFTPRNKCRPLRSKSKMHLNISELTIYTNNFEELFESKSSFGLTLFCIFIHLNCCCQHHVSFLKLIWAPLLKFQYILLGNETMIYTLLWTFCVTSIVPIFLRITHINMSKMALLTSSIICYSTLKRNSTILSLMAK